jgi:hypothetical protein
MEMQPSLLKYRQTVYTAIAMVCMPKHRSCPLLEDLIFFWSDTCSHDALVVS